MCSLPSFVVLQRTTKHNSRRRIKTTSSCWRQSSSAWTSKLQCCVVYMHMQQSCESWVRAANCDSACVVPCRVLYGCQSAPFERCTCCVRQWRVISVRSHDLLPCMHAGWGWPSQRSKSCSTSSRCMQACRSAHEVRPDVQGIKCTCRMQFIQHYLVLLFGAAWLVYGYMHLCSHMIPI